MMVPTPVLYILAAWHYARRFVLFVLPLLFGLGVASWCAGCGPSLASIEAETVRCEAEARAIVERVGTTEEEDLTDLAALRARCEEATQ